MDRPPGRVTTLALLAVLSGGCQEPTAPAGSITVAVAIAHVTAPRVGADGNQPNLQCSATLSATAAGTAVGHWGSATFLWYVGRDSVPFDSSLVDSATISQSWESDHITAGETEQATWSLTADVPFATVVAFRVIGPGGRVATVRTGRIVCGVAAPTTPPQVTALTLVTPPPYEPGQLVAVDVALSGAAGLWESEVRIDGACTVVQDFGEALATSVSRRVLMTFPRDCRLGWAFTVTAGAWDAALQSGSRIIRPGYIVDHTPPGIWLYQSLSTSALGGEYLTGDTVRLTASVWDNHAVASVAWSLDPFGTGDTLQIGGSDTALALRLVVPPAWSGLGDIHVTARDSSGNQASAGSSGGAFEFIARDPPLSRVTTIGHDITDAAFDMKRGVVYLLHGNDHALSVMSQASGAILQTLYLDGYTTAFDITPSNDSLVLPWHDRKTLGILDLATMTRSEVTPDWPDSLGPRPGLQLARVLANGRVMVLTDGGHVAVVDPATGHTTPWRAFGGSFERSYDRRVVVLAAGNSVSRYHVAGDSAEPAVTLNGPLMMPAPPLHVDGTGDHLVTTGYAYDGSFTQLSQAHGTVGYANSTSTQVAPGGAWYLYGLGPIGVYRVRTSDGARTDAIPMSFFPTLMRISDDGRWLLAAETVCLCYPISSKVALYDLGQLPAVAAAPAQGYRR